MLTAHQHTQHLAHSDSHIQGKCAPLMCRINLACISLYHMSSGCAHTVLRCLLFLFKMVDWTFEDALMAIQSQPSILASILQSADGLHLGDVCFAKIQPTLWMCTCPLKF